MELKINLPYSFWEYKISGVYKITFADGSFYIGASDHLRQRANRWELYMKKGTGIAGKNMGAAVLEKIKSNDTASFDILELCSPADVKVKEAEYLYENKENPLMVSWLHGAWKPVIQNTVAGIFVKRHMSQQSAAKYNGIKLAHVQRVLSGERLSHGGMIFTYEMDLHKRKDGRFVRRKKEKANGRLIVQMGESGNIIATFAYKAHVASSLGCHVATVDRVLSGTQKTAKGFFLKFIDPA